MLSIHGAPQVITGFAETIDFIPHMTTILLHDVLEGLRLSFPQFVDLGIMAGCDYNTNMKQIGIGRSYALITSYESIDNLPHDTTCLRHIRCRELFQYIPSSALVSGDITNLNVQERSSYIIWKRYTCSI